RRLGSLIRRLSQVKTSTSTEILFRHEDAAKIGGVISSLTPQDESKLTEFSAKLHSAGCIQKREAVKILGGELYSKLCAIGFVDENTVGNESGTFSFVTSPFKVHQFRRR